MQTKPTSQKEQTKQLVLKALLVAIVAILAFLGGFIKIGASASISLTLIPVVIGSAIFGPGTGALLGGVSGFIFLVTPDGLGWIGLNAFGTILTVMVKGIASGFLAGLTYKLLVEKQKNHYLAVLISAIVCPVVNTAIFLVGCRLFFWDGVVTGADKEGKSIIAFLLVFYVGLNFVLELLANIVLSPAIMKIIDLRKKLI